MVVAVTRSFNEIDIVEHSIRWMLGQVDAVVVGDNSTDGSREILDGLVDEFSDRLAVRYDPLPNYRQADVLTGYAEEARRVGAEWIVPFDLDERFCADEGTLAERLTSLPPEILIVQCANVTHCVTTQDDPAQADPFRAMEWRSCEQLPLRKVIVRAAEGLRIGHGNHDATFEGVRYPAEISGVIGARHFPYRSPEQFAKRVLGAYPQLQESGLPRSHGAHIWSYGEHWERAGVEGLHEWFTTMMTFDRPAENPEITHDPAPW